MPWRCGSSSTPGRKRRTNPTTSPPPGSGHCATTSRAYAPPTGSRTSTATAAASRTTSTARSPTATRACTTRPRRGGAGWTGRWRCRSGPARCTRLPSTAWRPTLITRRTPSGGDMPARALPPCTGPTPAVAPPMPTTSVAASTTRRTSRPSRSGTGIRLMARPTPPLPPPKTPPLTTTAQADASRRSRASPAPRSGRDTAPTTTRAGPSASGPAPSGSPRTSNRSRPPSPIWPATTSLSSWPRRPSSRRGPEAGPAAPSSPSRPGRASSTPSGRGPSTSPASIPTASRARPTWASSATAWRPPVLPRCSRMATSLPSQWFVTRERF
mmetsp:Transcript_28807/g.83585  ORF Transcript_28807/g.83585 Transcript_28807/m.83585 type:complete len:327 (+) Transcript_28807:1849-2829(+)